MKEKIIVQPGEKIEKISVPDDDAANWIKTLVEAGFSNQEIDAIMSLLNATYKGKMKQHLIEKEFRKIKEDTEKRHGHVLTPEECKKIKVGIASRFEE